MSWRAQPPCFVRFLFPAISRDALEGFDLSLSTMQALERRVKMDVNDNDPDGTVGPFMLTILNTGNSKPTARVVDIPRWHPRISPYRFFLFSTTITFGTVKVLAVQAGSSNVPTTLEWVGGTILSILFFSVSSYDTTDHSNKPPPLLRWLFLPDCMDILWILMRRPDYISTEKSSHQLAYPQPPITAYRILVCATVIIFGLGKASLSYLNILYPAAAWLDWTSGVPLFAILYCMGLYEYNSVDLFSPFFIIDRSDALFSATRGISHVALLFLSIGWTCLYAYTSSFITYEPSFLSELWFYSPDNDLVLIKALGHDILYAGALGGILACVLILRKIFLDVTSKQGMVRRILSPALSWYRRHTKRRSNSVLPNGMDAESQDDTMMFELREMNKAFNGPKHYDSTKKVVRGSVIFTPTVDLALYVLVHITTSIIAAVFFALLALIVPHSNWALRWPSSPIDAFAWLLTLMSLGMTWIWTLTLLAYAIFMAHQLIEPFKSALSVPSLPWEKALATAAPTEPSRSRVGWVQRDKLIGIGPFERLL